MKTVSLRWKLLLLAIVAFPIVHGSSVQLNNAQAAERRSPVDLSSAFIQIARRNIPAVVHIEVTAREKVAGPLLPFETDPFFRYFFGTPDTSRKFKRDVTSIGTGMLIDGQGHVLTNYHVAGGATKIEVVLSDGKKYAATLIGGDPKTDLAVLRIRAKEPFPHVALGDSDKTEVGEWVMAIGHPRGLDQTVTHGIISAKHRRGITDPSSYQDFIQTDAAINPGNSGGPLLNMQGEVIGVNTVIVSSSGGFEGIGLAIPSNMAQHVARTIIAHGKVQRGWIGITTQDLSPDQAQSLGLAAAKGAYVVDVVKESPGDKAGLRKGDVITAFNGRTVADAAALRNEVGIMPAGREVKATVLRGGKGQQITVRIGNLQDAAERLVGIARERLGIEVRALQPTEANRYGVSANQGIVITKVDPKGPLGKARFESGDIILEINGQAVAGLEGFVELASIIKPGSRVNLLAIDRSSGNIGTVQVVAR